MFLTVHRTRNGWVQACPDVRFSSEAEAIELLPTIAALVHKPVAAIKVVPQHIYDTQLV
jgi:hypothetical protein